MKILIQITRGFSPYKSSALLNGKRISLKKATQMIKKHNLPAHFIGNYVYGQSFSYQNF